MMTADRLNLETHCLGKAIVSLKTTVSTNDVARDLAQRGALDGTLVIADEQSAGRGRRGRVWLAPPDSSLLCSLILRPVLAPVHAPRLTMLAAVAARQAIRSLGLGAVIKWPNDILINSRKVAGILTETEIRGDTLAFAIVGIGVNVNIPAAGLAELSPLATSLLAEAGHAIEREQLLRLLLAEMDVRYRAMVGDEGEAVFQEWRANLDTVGREVTVKSGDETIGGVAEDVDADGALLVRRPEGVLVAVTFGDVS